MRTDQASLNLKRYLPVPLVTVGCVLLAIGLTALLSGGHQMRPVYVFVMDIVTVCLVTVSGVMALFRHRATPRPGILALGMGLLIAAVLEIPHLIYLGVVATQTLPDSWALATWCALTAMPAPSFIGIMVVGSVTPGLRRWFLACLRGGRRALVVTGLLVAGWLALLSFFIGSVFLIDVLAPMAGLSLHVVLAAVPTFLMLTGTVLNLRHDGYRRRALSQLAVASLVTVTLGQVALFVLHLTGNPDVQVAAYTLRFLSSLMMIVATIVGFYLAIGQEVGARRRVEQTVANLFDGVLTLDARGNVLSANPAVQRIFGYNAQQLLPRNVMDLIVSAAEKDTGDDGEISFARFTDACAGPSPQCGVGRGGVCRVDILCANGRVSPADLDLRPISGIGRARYIMVIHDVAARVRAEEDLRARNRVTEISQKIAAAANEAGSLPEAVSRCLDLVSRFSGCALAHAFEVVESGRPDRPRLSSLGVCYAADPVEDREARSYLLSRFEGAGKGLVGRALSSRVMAVVRQGADRTGVLDNDRFRASHLAGACAIPVLLAGRVRLVLEFYSREPMVPDAAFLEVCDHLSMQLCRVIEREDDARRLREARDEADRANRTKSDLLSSMSHELRTPLNAVLGFAQMLEKGGHNYDRDDAQRAVSQIRASGQHLLDLINDILDLSSIEAGRLPVRSGFVDPASLFQECAEIAMGLGRSRGITVRVEATHQGRPLPQVVADRIRLRQVLINLLGNAVKYGKAGCEVIVRGRVVDDDRVVVEVLDRGPGIAPEDAERVFEPFSRVGQEDDVHGVGIGLAICKSLIRSMKGEIGFRPREGGGSVFWFCLPQGGVGPSDVSVPREARLARAHARLHALTCPRTVLYIEDNRANAMLLEMAFRPFAAIRFQTCPDGERGIEQARLDVPDLILMDLNLPGMSGLEALRILRGDTMFNRVPVVAVSALSGERAFAEEGGRVGVTFDAYMDKPLDILEALEVVLAFLGDPQSLRSAVSDPEDGADDAAVKSAPAE